MVEELKLAIKIDDASIEQSLLKQFANAQKMADKVVLDFKNVNFDDKQIEAKFKEMQKKAGQNPIDLTIGGNTLDMLGQIDKRLTEIFSIGNGKSFIDSSSTVSEINKITQATKELNKAQTRSENIQNKSFTTKNKTEAYNQLKQVADVFKQFYGNEEAMHTKAGTEAAYAYYKAYEEALRKGVAESKLQKVTVDVDKDGFFNAERISSTRIKEFANFEKYGGEVTALSEEISYFEKRLLKFSEAYSQIQSKLGKAPITPEIIQNIEEYVRNLEIAEARTKDADLMGFTKEDIDLYKDSANMYLGFATEDAIRENEKYISSLKEVKEEKENVDASLSKSQISDMDSSLVEQQNKIQEELKETQKQAEQTSESLSKICDGNKSNISSENPIAQMILQAQYLDKTLNQIDIPTDSFDNVLQKLDRTKSELIDIVKITRQSFADADGKFHDSYTLKDSRGSTEIYGISSKTEKGQILRQNIVGYDAKKDSVNQSKEELEVQKQITAEIESQSKANQKKYQEFQREEQAYQKEQNQIAYNKLTETIRQYSEVAKRVSSGRAEDGDLQKMAQLEEKISQLQKQPILSESQVAKSESSLNSLYDQLDKIEKKLQETNQQKVENGLEKLSTYRGKSDKYSDTLKKFNDGGWASDEYIKNVNTVSEALKTYQAALQDIGTHELITSKDIDLLDKYESELKQAISAVQNMTAAQKGYDQLAGEKELNKISQILRENSNMSEKAKAEIRDYYNQIKSGNPSASLGVIHGKILDIVNAEEQAGRAGKSLWDIFKTSRLHQMVAQVAGMFSFYDAINTGKKVFSTINELDYALVDLKKTTSMSGSELNQFYYDSNDVAKQMGVTTKEIIDQASSWSRLGYSSKEAATEMAKLSSQFASISPGMTTEESQSGLVSIMKAWSIDPDQVKSEILDPINQLGNTMAEDNQDIIDGMERSASALAAVGTSTKDAFALFSGIQEVLQNAEKSGTSLRSVALRLRSFDETTEEYSSDLANITGELVNLTKTAEHAEGISVFKPGSTTEFKDLTDYFREIAGIWDEMSQKQQNDYLLKAFGRTQAQGGAALIQNFEAVDKALKEMNESAGSSDREMETVQQSLAYKLNELKETWVGIVQQTVKRGDISNILSGLTGISNVLGVIINKIGVGKTLLAGISAFIGRDKSKERFCPSW